MKAFAKDGHDRKRIAALVNRSLCALGDVKKSDEFLRGLFAPSDVVAIKLNCLAGPGLSSSPGVVDALVSGLHAIGIPLRHIILFERTTAELQRAGFAPNRGDRDAPLCLGNDEGGFDRELTFSGDVGSLFARIVTQQATALINVPVLKDHDLSGIGCGLKNLFGLIHNPNKYHDHHCNPFVADVANSAPVKDRLRLTVCDALTAQFHGGPAAVRTHQWRPGQILAATDPVALDRIAWSLIEEQRKAAGMKSLAEAGRKPVWIETAASYGLGESRRDRIRLLES